MRLTLVRAKVRYANKKHGHWFSWFLCECGNGILTRHEQGLSGQVKSCGCLNKKMKRAGSAPRHGHARKNNVSTTYRTWAGIIHRCENPNATKYELYGGRGIKMCQHWRSSFENFLADMGKKPKGTSLDRIDSDGNYEPGNCRWADIRTQNRNRRGAVLVENENGELVCIRDVLHLAVVSEVIVYRRVKKGWSIKEALFTPPFHKRKEQ